MEGMDSHNLTHGTPNATGGSVKSSSFRYYSLMILLGVAATTGASSFIAPRVIMWWYDSPAPTPVTAACVPAIEWAIRMFQWTQLISLGLGVVIGWVLAIRFRKKPQPSPLNR